jgi:hypothetical protein
MGFSCLRRTELYARRCYVPSLNLSKTYLRQSGNKEGLHPAITIVWADFKIYDMQAFDRIAAEDGAYRPLSCYPVGSEHSCHVSSNVKTVLKRSHSCGAQHVRVLPVRK